MKRTLFFILLLLAGVFGTLSAQQSVNPYGTYTIPAITQDEVGGASRIKLEFTEPLWTQDSWIITATSVKAPFNNQWGSWIFHLMTDENGSEIKLEFYDSTSSNGDNLKLANSTLVSGTGGLPLETPISIEVTSDGSGSLYVFARQGDLTGERTVTGIEYIYGVKNDYQRDVVVSTSNSETKIMPVADLNFGYVQAGASGTKSITVNAVNVVNPINWAIDGADKDYFSITPTSVRAGESINITFSPTEKREYNATVTLSSSLVDPVSFALTGDANFDLPVQISSEDNSDEHWYYIQFYRKAAANLVWALSDTTRMLIQDTLKVNATRDDMQWKICGDWENGYYLVNKVGKYGGKEITYCPVDSVIDGSTVPANRYIVRTGGYGDVFEFVRFGATSDWQFRNTVTGRYVNDSGGKFICDYNKDDSGNRLVFIVADKPTITTPVRSIYLEAPVGERTTGKITIMALGTNGAINTAISGADASMFSVSPASLPAEGGELTVTFSPTGVKAYSATLTLSSAGADDLTVALDGNSNIGLPVFSTGNNEFWYYIQFNRKPDQAWTAENIDGKIMQRTKVDINDEDDESIETEAYKQHWKFVGDWTNGYQIINRTGGAALFDTVSVSATAYYLVLTEEAAFGDKFLFKRQNATSKWQLQIVGKDDGEGYDYLNDYGGANGDGSIGLYVVNDSGNLLNFTAVDPVNIQNPALDDAIGAVIATKYYTLQGVELNRPTSTGVYIVKNIYSSGKVKAIKQLVVVK
ncbi:MAG: hypothetical protein LBH32_05260 [Dysgonamonadaceae bacterium]|jgi:hypothetical protein|nr:hypothetical protein [Dysgonamonadaceae bacterium]